MRQHGATGLQRLAAFSCLLLVAGMVGLAGSAAFAAGAQTVTIGASLSPKDITVAPGTTLTWAAADAGKHRIRTTAGPTQLDGKIEGGGSWSYTFTKVGTYTYLDDENKDNAALHGTVTVSTSAPAPGGGGAAPAPAAPSAASVSLANKAFSPASVTVAVGGVVTWTNNDSMPHNVTSNSGAFKSATLNPGQAFSFTFTTPGTYPYSCTFHGGMNGTVIVPTATGTVPPPAPAQPTTAPPNAPVPPGSPAAPGKAGSHTVTITDAGFSPAHLDARAGDTVTWVNTGAMPHTATAAGGEFDIAIDAGASASTVLQKPGTINYVCSYHAFMTASITVGAALAGVVIAPAPKAGGKKVSAAGGAGAGGAAPAGNGKTKTYRVQVQDDSFSPSSVHARVGDTISWTNVGQMPHTVTAGNGSFNHQLSPGQSYSYALRAVGTVAYVCSFHPGMDGTLVVGAALAGVKVPPKVADNGGGAATSGTAPAVAAPVSAGGKTKTIEIKVSEMAFAPAMVKANVGDTISWVNVGTIPHTVTAKDGSFDKTPLAPGQRFNYVLTKAGNISYVCSYHPGMDAMLMVGAALAGVAVPPASGTAGTKPASKAPVSSGTATTFEVLVKDNSFSPAMVSARVGDTISWVNVGVIAHTVTAKDHSFDTSLKPGQRFNLVLTKQGTINYLCTPHPGMFGMVMVAAAPPGFQPPAPPLTLAGLSPVAMSGVGFIWLLIIGLLTSAQLRARILTSPSRSLLARRDTSGDPS